MRRLNPAIQAKFETAEALRAKGDIAAAVALCQEIIAQSPQEPNTLHLMGIIAQQLGNPDLALQYIEAALAINPRFAKAWFNRSVFLRARGRNDDALHSARAAAELAPNIGEAWDMIGQILKDQGRLDEAGECHRRAIDLQPNNAVFHDNYSLFLSVIGDLPGSYREARKATLLNPNYPSLNLGNILNRMGYPEKAAQQFAHTRAVCPTLPEVEVNEAIALMQMGDMEKGWELWEKRPEFPSPLNTIPLWQGQKVSRLVLHEEQGLGDLIQWLRYIPLLKSRADHIEAYVRAPLRRLCEESFPYVTYLDEKNPRSDAGARCRWSSFPYFFGKNLDNIPGTPYLTASAERRAFWRDKLRDMPSPRIGIVWAGGKGFSADAQRSLNIDLIRPLIACGPAHFVSLQKGRPEKIDGIFDADPYLNDFADTAALIEELDLVISVDTSTAHLAGALNKPLFLLLRSGGDWRWFLGREDTPWYKTARLFRQSPPGDWTNTIENLAAEIKKFLSGNNPVLIPPAWTGENLRQDPHALPLPE